MPLSDWASCLVNSNDTGTLACIGRRSLLVPNPSLIFWFSNNYRLNLGNHLTWLITKLSKWTSAKFGFFFFLLFPAGCRFSKIGSCISNGRLQILRHFVARRRFGKILKGVLLNKLELFGKSTFSAGKYVTNKKYRCLKQLQNFKNVDSTLNIQLLFKLLTLRWNYFNLGHKTMLI